MPDSEDEIKGKIEVNEMYEIGKAVGKKIGEEENRQQPIGEYDDSEDKNILIDNFGRIAKKLRVSVTDRCNMRCMYCMPRGNVRWFNEQDVLDYREISRLVSILANLGIERIRLTGGEPLLRPNLENLIVSLAKLDGINSISMTTNGLLFGEKAKKLKDAGLESVNISLDTFRPARFKAITGLDSINKVIDAINAR